MEHTSPHFWQMVLENEVRLVVMLTKLKERVENQGAALKKVVLSIHWINKCVVSCCPGGGTERLMVKCHQYWPSSPGEVMDLPSSQLSVELLSEAPHERLSRLQIRRIKVKTL